MGGNGKGKETEIPANMRAQVQESHEQLVELVAEGDDKLMEEFFEKGTIPEEDLIPALHNAIREDKLFPVVFASGLGNIGADRGARAMGTHPSGMRRTRSQCRCMYSKRCRMHSREGFRISKFSLAC